MPQICVCQQPDRDRCTVGGFASTLVAKSLSHYNVNLKGYKMIRKGGVYNMIVQLSDSDSKRCWKWRNATTETNNE